MFRKRRFSHLVVAAAVLLVGVPLTAFAALPFEEFSWQRFANAYQDLADLAVVKTASFEPVLLDPGGTGMLILPDTVRVGSTITYTIAITNNGPDPATDVTLTDFPPIAASLVSVTPEQNCTVTVTDQVVCTFETLAASNSVTSTIVVTATRAGMIVNKVRVDSNEIDLDATNNMALVTTLSMLATAIDAVNGGEICNPGTQGVTTTVQVPPGAVTGTVALQFAPVVTPSQSISAGLGVVGHLFSLDVYREGGLESGFAFSRPVTITLDYEDEAVAGVITETLGLYYLSNDEWRDVTETCEPPSTIEHDPANRRVSVTICHLTDFGLLAEEKSKIYLPVILCNG